MQRHLERFYGTVSASAKMIAIIRKYNDSPMRKIKRSIQERDYVLLYPYIDRLGLKKYSHVMMN